MKSIKLMITGLLLLSLTACSGRTIKNKNPKLAVKDLNALNIPMNDINPKMLAFVQATVHSKDRTLIVSKYRALLVSIQKAILLANQVNPYNGDDSYKNAVLKYLNIQYSIMRGDYSRIVDEKKAEEETFDAVEAKLLIRQKANEKRQKAAENLNKQQARFAKNYNINLIQSDNETGRKLAKANEVFNYHQKIYLVFLKSNKQEKYVIKSGNKGDINGLEQNRATLEKFAKKGVSKLATFSDYNGDNSLLQIARVALDFYKKEAEEHLPIVVEYNLKAEQFKKLKQAFSNLRAQERSREDVRNFNAQVKQMNAMANQYNRLQRHLNKNRARLIKYWNKTGDNFLKRHVPK